MRFSNIAPDLALAADRIERAGESIAFLATAGDMLREKREARELRMEYATTKAQSRIAPPVEIELLQARIITLEETLRIQQERIAHLEQTTRHDSLTGLLSRDAILERVHTEWNRHANSHGELGLMFIDVDNFKAINDTFDHKTGDAALAACGAQTIRSFRRSGEVAGRYGGDELLVVLPTVTITRMAELAERLRASIAAIELPIGDTRLGLTASVGVATATPHIDPHGIEAFITRADEALKAAKTAGRNRVVAVQPELDKTLRFFEVKQQSQSKAQTRTPSRGR
ncbi:MAG: GGDEF domain-containing protein [Vulcanimicrobiaceae bacterium]